MSASGPRQGYVGMVCTKRPPFVVLAVDDLLDQDYVVQGQPGYANELVNPGDTLLRVEGADVSTGVNVKRLHELLAGHMHSLVELTFMRAQGGAPYSIKVRRHGMHEHERKPSAAPSKSPRAAVFADDAGMSSLQAQVSELESARADLQARLRDSIHDASTAREECEQVKKHLEELKRTSRKS